MKLPTEVKHPDPSAQAERVHPRFFSQARAVAGGRPAAHTHERSRRMKEPQYSEPMIAWAADDEHSGKARGGQATHTWCAQAGRRGPARVRIAHVFVYSKCIEEGNTRGLVYR